MSIVIEHERQALLSRATARCANLAAENARLRLRISELETMIEAAEDPEMSYAEAVLGLR